jgi:hypothetical protein
MVKTTPASSCPANKMLLSDPNVIYGRRCVWITMKDGTRTLGTPGTGQRIVFRMPMKTTKFDVTFSHGRVAFIALGTRMPKAAAVAPLTMACPGEPVDGSDDCTEDWRQAIQNLDKLLAKEGGPKQAVNYLLRDRESRARDRLIFTRIEVIQGASTHGFTFQRRQMCFLDVVGLIEIVKGFANVSSTLAFTISDARLDLVKYEAETRSSSKLLVSSPPAKCTA